ncbi:MAG: arginine deiminase family protein [Ignavibacteria bacterium]|jgi:dimethylargininase
MFTKAIVRTPCRNLVNGLTSANLELPDYNKAIEQHENYIKALQLCELEVQILEADENYPDSTFVEDTALLTPYCAVITNPGATTRKGETPYIKTVIEHYYSNIEFIKEPGTLEAGDVMMVGNHFYVGLSGRTNIEGAKQLIRILNSYSMSGSLVNVNDNLHLKSGVSYLENNILLAAGEFLNEPEFSNFNIINIDDDECYAANSLWVNNTVLVPSGFPKARDLIKTAGYKIIEVDVSEFQKLDGGLSCLSLRF